MARRPMTRSFSPVRDVALWHRLIVMPQRRVLGLRADGWREMPSPPLSGHLPRALFGQFSASPGTDGQALGHSVMRACRRREDRDSASRRRLKQPESQPMTYLFVSSAKQSAPQRLSRRNFLFCSAVIAAGLASTGAFAQGPGRSGQMGINAKDTGIVFIDPQNDVLSPTGCAGAPSAPASPRTARSRTWSASSRPRRSGGYEVFISPHYFYPSGQGLEIQRSAGDRRNPRPASSNEAANSRSKDSRIPAPIGSSGSSPISTTARLSSPVRTRCLARKPTTWSCSCASAGFRRIILGGMLANMCVESHLREFLEQGFEIAVVKDAVAGPRHPEWGDGYHAAVINYRYLAHMVPSTDEILELMRRGAGQ